MDKLDFKMLLIIKSGKDVSLIRNKYEDSQISLRLEQMLLEWYIDVLEHWIVITKLWEEKIKWLNDDMGNKNSDQRISLEIQSQIPKLSKEDIYIPHESEIDF